MIFSGGYGPTGQPGPPGQPGPDGNQWKHN